MRSFRRHPGLGAVTLFLLPLVACSGGGSSSPTDPMPGPPAAMASISFDVVGPAGGTTMITYMSGANTVFCSRNAGWASLWIRGAEQRAANGENGPHLDIDLCNHSGGGTFGPKDPLDLSCGGAKSWDIWWHAADGTVFNNQASAADCTFVMNQSGSSLSGMFECRGLTEMGGNRTVDVVGGLFDCTES